MEETFEEVSARMTKDLSIALNDFRNAVLDLMKDTLESMNYDVVKREPELKACPICNGKADVYNEARGYSISCDACDIGQETFYELRDEAIEAWNALPRKDQQ